MATSKTPPKPADDISAQLETLKADIALLGQALKSSAETKAEDYKETAQQVYGSLESDIKDLITGIEKQAVEKPLQTTAYAVGIGLVLGLLLKGNR